MFASILANGQIDYLASQEAQDYIMNEQIVALKSLKEDFEAGRTEKIRFSLRNRYNNLLSDPLIVKYEKHLVMPSNK